MGGTLTDDLAVLKRVYSLLDFVRAMPTAIGKGYKMDIDDARMALYDVIVRHNGESPPAPMLQPLQKPERCGN
jgi:hypothetical protein